MGYALCRRPPIIAHCFRIADTWHCCKRVLVFLGRKPVIWHVWWLHFGVLGDLGRFWDIGEHNKGHFEVQACIFTDLWWILVPMGVILHAWCLYFTVLADPGTILGRSWDIREYKKGCFTACTKRGKCIFGALGDKWHAQREEFANN